MDSIISKRILYNQYNRIYNIEIPRYTIPAIRPH